MEGSMFEKIPSADAIFMKVFYSLECFLFKLKLSFEMVV